MFSSMVQIDFSPDPFGGVSARSSLLYGGFHCDADTFYTFDGVFPLSARQAHQCKNIDGIGSDSAHNQGGDMDFPEWQCS